MFLSAKGLIAVCILKGFVGFPTKLEGPVIINTKKFLVVKVTNTTKTDHIEVTVNKKHCEVK